MKKLSVILLLVLVISVAAVEPLVWNSENKFSGWKALRNVKCETTSNALLLTDIAADPQIVSGPLAIDPTKFNRFRFRYRAEKIGKGGGELYYAHANGSFTALKMWRIPPLQGDGEWHTVTLTEKNLHNPVSWFEGGMITQLRFDPTNSPGGKIEISDFRLFFEPEKKTASPQKTLPGPLPSVRFNLDEPLWPAVKPEFNVNETLVVNEPYFRGKMLKSPHDIRDGGKYHTFFLRREFILRKKPVQGWLQYTADDRAEAFVNGHEVGRAGNWRIPDVAEISGDLKAGKNVLAFRYRNDRSAGGVLAELFVKYADGTFERIDTDGKFKTSVNGKKGWNEAGFDDSAWEMPVEQFGPPTPPWTTKLGYVDFSRPQKLLGASVSPAVGEAGKTVRLSFNFEGECPEIPLNVTLSLRKNDIVLWDELLTLDVHQVRIEGKDRWRIEMDYVLPLYLHSNDMTARVESGAIFCKSGGFPEVKLLYHGLKTAPGYEKPVSSRIVKNAYGPMFLLNDKPFFPTWGGVNQRVCPDKVPYHSAAPLNLVTVYCDTYQFWPECGKFDPSSFDRQAEAYRRQNNDAYFMWDLSLYPPPDWAEKFPDEMCRDNENEINRDGKTNHSFASQQALRDMEKTLVQAITYLENSPYANRIIGYRVNGGHTIEWLGWDPVPGRMLDFSSVAEKAFRDFAQKNYPELKDFSVPLLETRQKLDNGELLWDPEKHLNTIAYHDFYSNATADMLIHLCRKAKETLKNRKVVGTYYGYTFTLHGSGNSQMRAHYALKKVLDSGAVDFLMSPQAYSIRNIGDTCGDMKPFKSMSNNNIIPVIEDDSRTHNGPYLEYSGNYQTLTETATLSVMRRNMGIALCRNQPVYYYALCSGTEFDFPAMAQDIALLRKTGEHCAENQTRRNAEIALVVSEETIKSMPMLRQASATGMMQAYQKDGSVKQIPTGGVVLTRESFIGNATRYARLGAPVDYLLAEDMKDHSGDYKLYVFVNCFKYDEPFRKVIEKLREHNCVLVWVYAPGYTFNGTNSTENMKRLTGIDLLKVENPIIPAVKLTDGRLMGTQTIRIAPMFHVPAASEVEVLGTYENGKMELPR